MKIRLREHRLGKSILSIVCALSLMIGMVPPVLAANGSDVSRHVVNNTVTPSGIVLNLFDYWVTPNQDDSDKDTKINDDNSSNPYRNAQINKDHQLKFSSSGLGSEKVSINQWTHGTAPFKGIVQKKLQGGYPVLAAGNVYTRDTEEKTTAESLSYLFDRNAHDGKQAFWNVQGLLQVDSDGYYYYNADNKKLWKDDKHTGYQTANFAEFDKSTNRFTLYDSWGVEASGAGRANLQGQFFPFNSAEGDADGNDAVFSGVDGNDKLIQSGITSVSEAANHYFGMTMTTRFVQRYGGKTSLDPNASAMTFEFAGDDDVWLFIDGILVCDLGGIHDQARTSINFFDGKIIVGTEEIGTLKSVMSPYYSEKENASAWNGDTFADNTYHTMKLFYLERGGTDSNLAMKFNLAHVPETDGVKVDQNGYPLPGVKFALYAATKNDATGQYEYDTESPLAEGTTDEKGRFVLADGSDATISLNELKQKGVTDLVLRETSVRSGYRPSEDFYLHLADYQEDILLLNDTGHQWRTGSYAQPKEAVYVNPNIRLRNQDGSLIEDPVDISIPNNGKMFAVVMRRLDHVGVSAPTNSDRWGIVTGNAMDGWRVETPTDNRISDVLSVIKSTENRDNYFLFEPCSNGSYMTLLDNCPGDMREYYFWVEEKSPNNAEAMNKVGYAIAYYYTTANSLSEANEQNTHWVYSDVGAGFEHQFTAKLYIPNVKNYLFVKKVDTNGEEIDGVTFSLYKKNDLEITTDEATGALTWKAKPGADVYDSVVTDGIANWHGIAEFPTDGFRGALDAGEYYLVETAAPAGYRLNPTPIHVVVDKRGVLVDAGSEDDGVSVSVSEGALLSTLKQFAEPDGIDYTLTDVKATKLEGEYVEGTGVVFRDTDEERHMTVDTESYLENVTYSTYDPADPTGWPMPSQPWVTNTGWIWFRVEQELDGYSVMQAREQNQTAYKQNIEKATGSADITPLFASKTTVIVQDQAVNSLTVSKKVEAAAGSTEQIPDGQEFTFTVTLADKEGTPLADTSVRLTGSSIASGADAPADVPAAATDSSGTITLTLKHGQAYTISDLPVGTRWVVTETPPAEGVWATKVNGATGTAADGEIIKGKASQAAFINIYGRQTIEPAVSDQLAVTKSYSAGSSDASGIRTRFAITAKDPANAPLPEVNSEVTITGANTGYFGAITFTAEGRYTYCVSEVNDGVSGMSYDPAQYEVTFTVTDTGANTLAVTDIAYARAGTTAALEAPAPAQDPMLLDAQDGRESGETPETDPESDVYDPVEGFRFENGYTEPPEEKKVIGALDISKSYAGEVYDGKVEFIAEPVGSAPTPDKTRVSIYGAGQSSFGSITFTAPGRYTYRVSEVDEDISGMRCDPTKYTVTIEIREESDGSLAIGGIEYKADNRSYSYDGYSGTGMIFRNDYSSSPEIVPTGALSIRKTVSGAGADQNGEFTFLVQVGNITGVYGGVAFTDGQAAVTVRAGGSVTIGGLPDGAHYSVKETAASSAGYTVTAQNAEGTITADRTAAVLVNNDRPGSTPPDGGDTGGGEGGNTPALNRTEHYAYIIGYEDGTLRPAGDISRAEVATIFFRLLRDPVRAEYWCQTNPYSDVAETAWYNNAISTLTNMGIISGYEDGSFHPDAPITRAELTKIAAGFFADQRVTKPYDGRFSDVSGKEWFAAALEKALEEGIIEGYGDGTFGPNRNITRAECCTIINRTLGRRPDADHLLPLELMVNWPDNSPAAWYYAQMQEATNSHDYRWITQLSERMEDWTGKLPDRDWAALERIWSRADSSTGGEVMN